MNVAQVARIGLDALIATGLAAGVARGALAQVTVGRNVQVSAARATFPHDEPMVAADPKNANRLVAGSHFHPTDTIEGHHSIVYASFDGGKTWQASLDRRDSTTGGDVAFAYGPDGSALFATLARGRTAYRSRDGGKTWDEPTKIPPGISLDREYIAADFTGGKYHGRVYMNGTIYPAPLDTGERASAIGLYTSTDGGTTWNNPVMKVIFRPRWIIGMGNCVVLSDGTVVALFGVVTDFFRVPQTDNMTAPSASLFIARSTDGGATVDNGIRIGDFWMNASRSAGAILPSLAVDPGSAAFKDRLYAVWTDFRSKRLEILLSYSTDKGKTWSAPQVINDDRPWADPTKGPDAMAPNVVVNKDGIVGITWYDRRETTDNMGWTIRFRASADGGETWSPSVKVSDAPSTYGRNEFWYVPGTASEKGDTAKSGGKVTAFSASLSNFSFSPGHLSGLAATADGVFHPLWIDNRTGVDQIWTAPVTVQMQVARNGGGELATMHDLGGKAALLLANAGYDRATNRLTFRARLKNTTKTDTLRGPIKARIVSLRSDIAIPELLGADNGIKGPGAVFDLTALVPPGGLKPDSVSAAWKDLVVQLTDLRPFKQGSVTRTTFATMEARLLGPSGANTRVSTGKD